MQGPLAASPGKPEVFHGQRRRQGAGWGPCGKGAGGRHQLSKLKPGRLPPPPLADFS